MTRQFEITRTWQAPLEGLNLDDPVELIRDLQSPDLMNCYHDNGFIKKALGYAQNDGGTELVISSKKVAIGKIYQFISQTPTKYNVAEGIQTAATAQRHVVKHTGTTWSTTAIKSSLNATADINFATFGNFLVFGNGVDFNYVWNGTNAYRLGIGKPTNTLADPTVAAGVIPNATFQYKYTYRNSTTGFESNPITSAKSWTYNLNEKGTFAAPTNSSHADEGVDKWVLYRTVAGGAAAGPYYKVAEAAVASSIEDNLADSALGAKMEEDHDLLPPCRVFHVYRRRIFATVDPSNPSTVYWSRIDKPAYFPQGIGDATGDIFLENVELGDGDQMRGLGDLGNIIVFCKERSLHGYVATGANTYAKVLVNRRHGCTNHRSIVQRDGLYMADQNGAWFFDGQSSVKISGRIDSAWSGMSAAGKTKFHAVWFEPLKFYILFYQRSGSASTDACFIFDTRNQRPREDRIGIFRMEPLSAAGSGLVFDSDNDPQVWIGDIDAVGGRSYRFLKPSTYAFAGAHYPSYFKTKHFQIDPHGLYRFRDGITTALSSGDWDITLSWALDFGRKTGGTAAVSLTSDSAAISWEDEAGAITWEESSGDSTAYTWGGTATGVSDKSFNMEGESKTIQMQVANGTSGQFYAVSKVGTRAQFKKAM